MRKNEISLVDLGGNSEKVPDAEREKLNVNSPRSVTTNTNTFAAANLITSVSKDDIERQKEMAKRMGGRVGDHDESEQENVSSETSPKPNGSRKFSCWLCCGSNQNDAQYKVYPTDENLGHEDDNNIVVSTHSNNEWAEETKIMEQVDEVDAEVDSKEVQYAIEISESEEEQGDGLLNRVSPEDKGRKCLVLDLDETLVHSSFQPVECSFSLPIELDGQQYKVYVLKRPFVDEFITECAKLYELVIFTASLSEYANPVIDTLDKKGLIKHRLFRESCVFHENQVYVKDLSRLGRNIKECIIIDNSPFSFLFDPNNAIGCTSWFGDENDTELRDLLPVLSGSLLDVKDVRTILDASSQSVDWLINQYGDKNKERKYSITE